MVSMLFDEHWIALCLCLYGKDQMEERWKHLARMCVPVWTARHAVFNSSTVQVHDN